MRAPRQSGFIALFLAAAVVLTGCGLSIGTAKATTTGDRQADSTSWVSWSTGKPRTLLACIDVTASVPRTLIHASVSLLGREFREQARPGSGPFVAYVRTITSNSINPSNNLLLAQIPGVPKPKHIKPSIFALAKVKHEAERQWAAADAKERKLLARARAVANREAKRVARLDPPTDGRGTDLYACPAVASRIFPPGQNTFLLMVSDLVPSGSAPTKLDYLLPGTHVYLFQYCGSNLPACQHREKVFDRDLLKKGAQKFTPYDIVVIPTLDRIFNP